jgi:hypothetical protein
MRKKKSHFFSFTKLENRSAEQVLHGGNGTCRMGKEIKKGFRMMNMVQKLCIHVCKCKKSETIPGMRGDEREWCGE